MNHKQIHELGDQELIDMIIRQPASWRNMLSTLLMRHHSALLTRCYVYLRNREDAEDACQETELRVFRAITSFRGDSSFRTWLFAIANRQCYDIAHKRTRQIIDNHLRALIEIHEMSVNKVKPMDDRHTVINAIVNNLPDQERDVIMLRYHLDLSLQDVSTTLGISLSATKMRLYRALDKCTARVLVDEQTLHA